MNELTGIVFMGGKSSRMGQDKAFVNYFDSPQFEKVFQLLGGFCDKIFCSINKAQKVDLPFIRDDNKLGEFGPIKGLISCLEKLETAVLVMAIDYPAFGQIELEYLIENRNTKKLATVIFDENLNFFHPFLGIYEKECLPLLLKAVESREYSMQRILKSLEVEKVILNNSQQSLQNINTKEEKSQFES